MATVARVKNQGARRAQIVEAAKSAVAQRGLTGLRLKDVAEECGLTAGAVAYYYPDLDHLVREVHRDASMRFSRARAQMADADGDPRVALVHIIRAGVPTSADDVDFQVLNEFHVHAHRDTYHAQLMSDLFEQEVALYIAVLDRGARDEVFTLHAEPTTIARSLVALEDACGMHVMGRSRLSPENVLHMITATAGALTGSDLVQYL